MLGVFHPWLYLFEVAGRSEKGQICANAQLLFKALGSEGATKLWSETDCPDTLPMASFGKRLHAQEKVMSETP